MTLPNLSKTCHQTHVCPQSLTTPARSELSDLVNFPGLRGTQDHEVRRHFNCHPCPNLVIMASRLAVIVSPCGQWHTHPCPGVAPGCTSCPLPTWVHGRGHRPEPPGSRSHSARGLGRKSPSLLTGETLTAFLLPHVSCSATEQSLVHSALTIPPMAQPVTGDTQR